MELHPSSKTLHYQHNVYYSDGSIAPSKRYAPDTIWCGSEKIKSFLVWTCNHWQTECNQSCGGANLILGWLYYGIPGWVSSTILDLSQTPLDHQTTEEWPISNQTGEQKFFQVLCWNTYSRIRLSKVRGPLVRGSDCICEVLCSKRTTWTWTYKRRHSNLLVQLTDDFSLFSQQWLESTLQTWIAQR